MDQTQTSSTPFEHTCLDLKSRGHASLDLFIFSDAGDFNGVSPDSPLNHHHSSIPEHTRTHDLIPSSPQPPWLMRILYRRESNRWNEISSVTVRAHTIAKHRAGHNHLSPESFSRPTTRAHPPNHKRHHLNKNTKPHPKADLGNEMPKRQGKETFTPR